MGNLLIKNIVTDVSDKIKQMLGDNMIGIYLFGSLVLGDFNENFSDIDLMIVLKRDINKGEFEKIKDLQKYISEKYSRFGTDGIEMIFVSTETIKNYLDKETFLTAVAPGNPLETIVCKPEFLIYFYIVRNYGETILGTPKEKVFPIISETDFVNMSNRVALENIPYWKESCKKTLHEQFYSVITLCRALYIKENKTYPSKLEAKNRAKIKYPNFKNIIDYAWRQRGKWKETDKPTDKQKYEEIIKFLEFAKIKLSYLVIENIKENIVLNEDVLEILKYSHFNPTKEKLSKLVQKYHEGKDILPFASFDKDKISGIIVVQKIEGRTYEIIDIAVDKHHRGQGVASKLIGYVIKNLGIKTLFAETDDDAVGFYEKYGFKTELTQNKKYTRYKCTLKTFEIVRLRLEDFEKCGNIWDLNENKKFTQSIYADLKSGNRVTFVYKDLISENFLGEVSIVFDDEEIYAIKNIRIYLSRLIVKDTCRNQGIGTLLCNYIFNYCKKLGYKEMTLAVNLDNFGAIKLYHKLGFTKILDVRKDEYGEYIVLLKRLN